MGASISNSGTTVAELPGQPDRRQGEGTSTIFSLLYSGMDLALFVDFPGMKEPLCVTQSRISWVEGRRFGVELGSIKSEEKNCPQFFLWNRVAPSDHDGGICNRSRNKEVPS